MGFKKRIKCDQGFTKNGTEKEKLSVVSGGRGRVRAGEKKKGTQEE